MSYTLYTHKRVYTQCDCCSFMCGKGQLQGAAVKNWSRYVLLAWAVAFLILGLTHRRIKICIPIHTCMHACMHSRTVIKCHWIWHSVDCQLHWGASGLVGSRLSMFTGFMKTKLFMGFSYISSSLSHFFLLLILLTVTLSLLLFLIFSFLFSSVIPPLISLPFQPCPFSFLSLIFIFILFSFAPSLQPFFSSHFHSLVKFAAITCWITSPPPLVLSYTRCGTSLFGRLIDFQPHRCPAVAFVSCWQFRFSYLALLYLTVQIRSLRFLPPTNTVKMNEGLISIHTTNEIYSGVDTGWFLETYWVTCMGSSNSSRG